MRRAILLAALSFCPSVVARAQTSQSTPSERGTYSGTGRACYGKLTIDASRIAWATPFSECSATGFKVLDRHVSGANLSVTYLLHDPGPKCRYKVVMLTHDGGNDMHIDWNVIGFTSLSSYDPQKPETGLSCYLVK